jgi:hypothetical protein
MTTKPFTLDLTKFDNSDPNATTYDEELCKILGICLATLNKYLPRSKYKRDRDTGIIKGIRPRMPAATATATASVSVSEPVIQEASVLETIVEGSFEDAGEADEAEEIELDSEAQAEEAEVFELASKKSKMQKEPININKIVIDQYNARINADNALTILAESFDKLCECRRYPGRPKKDIQPSFKDALWNRDNGELEKVKCPCCCHNIISRNSFHAGHIKAESRGGSHHMDNFMPICSKCNTAMGSLHMYTFAYRRFKRVLFKIPVE